MTTALLHLAGQLRYRHTRRRCVEKTLHRLGMSRSRALKFARFVP